MALNAVLHDQFDRKIWTREECESTWGRSYLDHLNKFDQDPSTAVLDPKARMHADQILKLPLNQSALVQIGSAPDAELRLACDATQGLLEICSKRVTPTSSSSLLMEQSD